ncbi:MAG: helix-turn-helix domain-containing protein [Chloroflexota bacterium]
MRAKTTTTRREQRADEIRRAAIAVFARQGFRRTSMADLAAAAGVSRPALYQYFDDRADLFRAAFDAVLQDSADAAVAALQDRGTVTERLDGYLQRAYADGYEALSSTPFGAELMEARHEFAADVAEAASERTRHGLRRFVGSLPMAQTRMRSQVIDLLTLAPAGLKGDHPSPAIFRARLSTLAQAAARMLESD